MSSNKHKIKRKSRRHRTIPPEASPEEANQVENEAPRQKTRRAHRDKVEISTGEVKTSRHRSSILTSHREDGSSRRTPSHSIHRHSTLSTGAPSLVSSTTKRRSDQTEVSTTARRALTSSASSIRPSNRKRLDASQFGEINSFVRHQHWNSNNNDPEFNGDEQQSMSFGKMGAGPETFSIPGQEDWVATINKNNKYAVARVALPSRASKHRNLSAGANKKPRARSTTIPVTKQLPDRPPSRQRHAFPTHLIDANAFDAPETAVRREGSSSSASSISSARNSGRRCSPTDLSFATEGIVTDRPPSRYMVKAKRNSKPSPTQDSNARSRRDVVEKNIVFSNNQVYHDPKTDGFAEVDESVPPPFRIEVTTDVSEPMLDSPAAPSSELNTSQNSRSARPWPFSNQEQLLRMVVAGSDGIRGNDQTMSSELSQLQWFGKDDQIDNAHLFETVITLPSPRASLTPEADIAIEDDLEDSDDPQNHSREVVNKQQQPEYDHVETHFPSRRAAAASKMNAPTTTLSVTDNPELQWIRSSTNPFFVDSPSTVDYDSMDPETAIEQTPLYSSEDLMTLAATEMTDLHLDDYTALGDVSMPAPPPTSSGMDWGSRLLPPSRSPPLRTSLGKDFLSLFAQH